MHKLTELSVQAFETSTRSGFLAAYWDANRLLSTMSAEALLSKLMLVTTELAEAAEEVRVDSRAKFFEELADVIIRVLDLCGTNSVDIGALVEAKMTKNKSRAHKHEKVV